MNIKESPSGCNLGELKLIIYFNLYEKQTVEFELPVLDCAHLVPMYKKYEFGIIQFTRKEQENHPSAKFIIDLPTLDGSINRTWEIK